MYRKHRRVGLASSRTVHLPSERHRSYVLSVVYMRQLGRILAPECDTQRNSDVSRSTSVVLVAFLEYQAYGGWRCRPQCRGGERPHPPLLLPISFRTTFKHGLRRELYRHRPIDDAGRLDGSQDGGEDDEPAIDAKPY